MMHSHSSNINPYFKGFFVLILVVMDDALARGFFLQVLEGYSRVLILVVMDDALAPFGDYSRSVCR